MRVSQRSVLPLAAFVTGSQAEFQLPFTPLSIAFPVFTLLSPMCYLVSLLPAYLLYSFVTLVLYALVSPCKRYHFRLWYVTSFFPSIRKLLSLYGM
jgi:hypothetical protein